MDIYVRVKALGKRKDLLEPVLYSIPKGIGNLRELLSVIAEQEAQTYNRKGWGEGLLPFLTAEEIADGEERGKVTFGAVYSQNKADVGKAVETVVRAFHDGLVRVFMEEQELTALEEPITIPEGSVFTFIRLTFLTGRMW